MLTEVIVKINQGVGFLDHPVGTKAFPKVLKTFKKFCVTGLVGGEGAAPGPLRVRHWREIMGVVRLAYLWFTLVPAESDLVGIERPRAEHHVALLFIEREVLDVDDARALVDGDWDPQDLAGVLNYHVRLVRYLVVPVRATHVTIRGVARSKKCGVDIHGERAEREPITRSGGLAGPSGQGVWGQRPPEAANLLLFGAQRRASEAPNRD